MSKSRDIADVATGIDITGNVTFGDNDKAIFGAGSDLQIYHTGTESIIADVGTGDLNIEASDDIRLRQVGGAQNYIYCHDGGEVILYHNGSQKIATSATGIDVTGTVGATTLQTNAGGTVTTAAGNDLNIVYPAGRSLFIKEGSETHVAVDNAGNVLVGQTTASSNTVGTSLRSDGRNFYCADGNYSAHFNRKSSDGPIAHFAKDDTIVGSIGVVNANNMFLSGSASNHAGVQFGTQNVTPYNNGSQSDGAVDLGASNLRWKDAYFSGGVTSSKPQGGTAFHASTAGSYIQVDGSSSSAMAFGMTGGNGSPATAASTSLGFHHWNNSSWANPVNITRDGIAFNTDTAEANALDDYEEGTFNAAMSGSTGGLFSLNQNKCFYTKVGRMVSLSMMLQWSANTTTGSVRITNLPFVVFNTDTLYRAAPSIGYVNGADVTSNYRQLIGTASGNGSQIDFFLLADNAAPSSSNSWSSSGEIQVSITYFTNS